MHEIKPRNKLIYKMYEKHEQFHDGDAGLDLFIVQKQTIQAGKTEDQIRYHVRVLNENRIS